MRNEQASKNTFRLRIFISIFQCLNNKLRNVAIKAQRRYCTSHGRSAAGGIDYVLEYDIMVGPAIEFLQLRRKGSGKGCVCSKSQAQSDCSHSVA